MKEMIHGQTLIQFLENVAPKKLVFDGDRIGCQIGSLNKKIQRVMVTLDVLENVVDEAIEKDVDLIISHHAVIYQPMKKVLSDSGQGKIITKCLKHDIAVYVMHTNFDIAKGGMNDILSDLFNLSNSEILQPTYTETLKKIAVYVPKSHAEIIRQVLGDVGAGAIGDYSHCTFSSIGEGAFKPGQHANPFIGEKNRLERVEEVKIETVVQADKLKKVIAKMIQAHPYEEVAYDVFPIEAEGDLFGLGRLGILPGTCSLGELAEQAKQILKLDGVRVTGDINKKVRKAAISGGDGKSLVPFAKFRGADVLITGDIDYHTAHEAMLHNLCLIDIGHHSEKVMIPVVKDRIALFLKEEGFQTEVIPSVSNTNPFMFI